MAVLGLFSGLDAGAQALQADASSMNAVADIRSGFSDSPAMAALSIPASSSAWNSSAASRPASIGTDSGLGPGALADAEAALPQADRVLVDKADRRLYLLRKGDVLRAYKVSLGLRPEGHKQFEGDFRTPEGVYRLTRRNPNSEYFLSIQVDYPNAQDQARARRRGLSPGGAIMIHGEPNAPRKPRDYYANVDWTEGCIAVSNSDMVEIWLMTPPDTPIEIRP
ncbi:hypothetical protein ACG33_01335 [Steroidobacter denitrificans]|uniref:L,D-TPase catalytic domain-containing protein n=2 Tax=Steroidobacter denitrificans TaxID=465721 RepID=A0A127F892_STEDE|nr:hypothetical protein ACG33_01335 [Steroidobacter denitrificans]